MKYLSANISEKANLIWSIADKLTGTYKPHESGEVVFFNKRCNRSTYSK